MESISHSSVVETKVDVVIVEEKLERTTVITHPDEATRQQELLNLEEEAVTSDEEQVVYAAEEITEVLVVPQVPHIAHTEVVEAEEVVSKTIVYTEAVHPVHAQADSSTGKWREVGSECSPPIDIVECPDSYYVYAEVPGMKVKDINIDLSDNLFTLTGTKRDHPYFSHYTQKNVVVEGINKGKFKRVLELPENVDISGVSVQYEEGIVQCKIRKLEPVQANTIGVQEEVKGVSEKGGRAHKRKSMMKGGKKRGSCLVQ